MTNAHKHNTLNVCMDQDGTNEHCQDKEHSNNNIMATVYRINNCISFTTPVIILCKKNILVLRQRQKKALYGVIWTGHDSIQLQAQITGLSIVLFVAAVLKQSLFEGHCFPDL